MILRGEITMIGYEKPVIIKTNEGESNNMKQVETCPKKCNAYCTDWNCAGMCSHYIENEGWSFLGAQCGLQLSEEKVS